MYYYWGFGLKIASEIEFPELLPFEFVNPPDVHISICVTPATLNGKDVINLVRLSVSATEYLLKLGNKVLCSKWRQHHGRAITRRG